MDPQKLDFESNYLRPNDAKILKLKFELGMQGFGIYIALVDLLKELPSNKMPLYITEILAERLYTTQEEIEDVIQNFGLFELGDDSFCNLESKVINP